MVDVDSLCLLTGKGYVPRWLARTLEHTVANTDAEFELIVNSSSTIEQDINKDRAESGFQRPISWLKSRIEPNPQSYVPLSDVSAIGDATNIECTVEPAPEEIGVVYPTEVVDQVHTCDLAVHYMVGILKGEILTTPRHGVVGYHHGDIRKYRGTPNSVWQYLNDESYVSITLQRYNKKLDAGEMLAFETVDIKDRHQLEAILRH